MPVVWIGQWCRAAHGGGAPLSVDDGELLRPAIEEALVVARTGEEATPPIAAPPALRPYLRFTRLPKQALHVVENAIERDEQFRLRVAECVDEQAVGRAGWLWLTRPQGWRAELESLSTTIAAQRAEEDEAKRERRSDRQLALAEAAARQAKERATVAETALEALQTEMADERRARREADDRAERAASEHERLLEAHAEAKATLDEARNARTAATRRIDELMRALARTRAEVDELRARVEDDVEPANASSR